MNGLLSVENGTNSIAAKKVEKLLDAKQEMRRIRSLTTWKRSALSVVLKSSYGY